MSDPRDRFFEPVAHFRVTAHAIAQADGMIAGTDAVVASMTEIGITPVRLVEEGTRVSAGAVLVEISGTPKQIALAEERLVGVLAKPSGIATATAAFVERAGPRMRVVSGAWKKLPFSQKEMIRHAIIVGGAMPRIAEWPFLYIDKNFVRMQGGLAATLEAARRFEGWTRIVQVRGEYGDVSVEAVHAARAGATIVFVDSGRPADAAAVAEALRREGLREAVSLAFAGGVQLGDVEALASMDVDIVDIGRPIVDAPLLDINLDVVCVESAPVHSD
ncbi:MULTISPECIES: beta/alpha barrel domain-containing protein [Paraburkholderia]|uniref:Nicotinate-nucleotide pyrophosphorylase n=1 Tax=Paraburkholderia metrosideri TaxID=580937 RepID=A0ABW9E233_9BURK